MTSPGSRVTTAESRATSDGTEKTMPLVRDFCRLSPLTRQPSSRSSGSSISSGVMRPDGGDPGRTCPARAVAGERRTEWFGRRCPGPASAPDVVPAVRFADLATAAADDGDELDLPA
jgi:hypothetical protein